MADLNVEDDEYCFACGSKNTIGLHLDFKQVENSVVCEFVADKLYQGYAGILHGGIASTLLDEVMAWQLIKINKIMAVTVRMEVKFRKPVPIGQKIIIKASYDHCERNFHFVKGEIRSEDGKLLVSSTGVFAEGKINI